MMKRIFSLVAAVLLLFSLAACTRRTVSEDIVISFLRLGNDEAERIFWYEVIADFEAAHPGIKVEYDEAAIGDDMDVKLTSLFVVNDGPDVVGHGIMSVASRVEAGHYTSIREYFNAWDGRGDIFPQLVELGTYNGEIYGIAYQPAPYVFAYRIDMLEEAGFTRPPETWSELAEYARALTITENNRITRAGFTFPAAAGNFVEYDVFAYGNGGGFVGPGGSPSLNTPENLEALEFIAALINDVSLEYHSNEINPFMTGNAAMTLIDNVRLAPMFNMDEYRGKVGLALPPSNAGKRQMTFSGCRLLFIGKDSRNRDAAFDFIRFAVSADIVEKRAIELNVPVVRASLVNAFAAADPLNAVRADSVANGVGMPITTWSSMFQRIRNEAVQRALHGDDPATILIEAQAMIEQEIVDAGR